ncbi:MAG: phosphatidylglycerophosphatase A [Planctomycetota bacterium]|nr:MAG: phosphatidylglycerophosphatase A [Planctomycetota bacterium]REJ94119.1 MAG: phosphatidylglycerophosphatase A [Planctomycetota bacterium]REK26305.1 MAG: phosphatidylglycerophosphatase A [Planctomycetota bacterium]REK45856.1 MAG: phosphatidylglycerophosphatase A [Planctomycetota bacterium]
MGLPSGIVVAARPVSYGVAMNEPVEAESTSSPAGSGARRFDPILFIATGAGFGYSPFASGTVGAVWGLPLAWLVAQLEVWIEPRGLSLGIQLAVIAAAILIGIPVASAAARRLGGAKDPGAIVWDEIASMLLVFLFVPVAEMSSPLILGIGFVLHRFFDVVKLPPCRQLERLPNGLGIMADDVVAALYACVVLHAVRWLWLG